MEGCKGAGTRLTATPWRGGRGTGKPINFSWAIIPGEKWEWSEKWEWARGSRCIITKAPLHKKALSRGVADGCTASSQGPANWALRARVTDEDTEAQRGAVTCPGSHSCEVVEQLALFQPPVLFTSGAWEWWPWYPPGEGLSPHCPCNYLHPLVKLFNLAEPWFSHLPNGPNSAHFIGWLWHRAGRQVNRQLLLLLLLVFCYSAFYLCCLT